MVNRGVYIFGMIAALFNGIRVYLTYNSYKGSMVAANVVAFLCILVSFVRMEKGDPTMKDDEEDEDDGGFHMF